MDHLIDDSDRLKPCPFCGAPAEIITLEGEDDPGIGAQCVQCTSSACGAASGLVYPLMDDVTDLLRERWNKRASDRDAQEREINELRTALDAAEAKIKAMEGQEPVKYESRGFYAANTSTPGWGKWESIEARGLQSAASVLFDLQEYIRSGYKYEIRPLYLAAGAKP